jgi:hypothetical protein
MTDKLEKRFSSPSPPGLSRWNGDFSALSLHKLVRSGYELTNRRSHRDKPGGGERQIQRLLANKSALHWDKPSGGERCGVSDFQFGDSHVSASYDFLYRPSGPWASEGTFVF